jgi:hypothetical protein
MTYSTQQFISGITVVQSGDLTGIDLKQFPYTEGGDMYSRELYVLAPAMREKQFREIAKACGGDVKLSRKHGKRVIVIPTSAEYGDAREGAIMRVYVAILEQHGLSAHVARQVD